MLCGSVLPEQISRTEYLAVLGFYSHPALFFFLLPLSWYSGRAWIQPDHEFATSSFSVRFSLFFICRPSVLQSLGWSFRISCICCIFVLYMVLEEGFWLTSHTTLFHLPLFNCKTYFGVIHFNLLRVFYFG